VQCLAVVFGRQAIATITMGSGSAWRLAVRVVLPGEVCNVSVLLGAWRLAACVPRQAVWKHISPSGSTAALGYNTMAKAWIALDVRDLQCFDDILKVGLLDIPLVVARNMSLELWLGIGVKHVAFLELWLGMTSLELWLGMASLALWLEMADEHEEPLSCGSGWRVLLV